MLTWASLIAKGFSLINLILAWVKEEQLKGIGRKEAINVALDAALRGIQIAEKAREEVRNDLATNPRSLRDDDGFRRPD